MWSSLSGRNRIANTPAAHSLSPRLHFESTRPSASSLSVFGLQRPLAYTHFATLMRFRLDMGLIPLRLGVAGLEPTRQSSKPTRSSSLRSISSPIPLPSSNHQLTLYSPSSETSLRARAMPTCNFPYGDEQWRRLLDEVKDLFQKGLFKNCSDHCVTALEQVRGPVRIYSFHLAFLTHADYT